MFWNRRAVRIGVGLALLALGLIVVLPTITGYTSLDGIVNARLWIVVAPIEGTVVTAAPPAGTPLPAGEHLLSIKNERVNLYQLSEFSAELKATQDTLNALALQEKELVSLRDDLRQRFDSFREAMIRNIDRELVAQQERIGASEARAEERKSEFARKQKLQVSGHLSESELDRTRAAEDIAQHELEGSRNELDRLKRKREAAQKGIFIEEGRNDVPYSLQRVDEVTIALVTLASRRDELEARVVKLRKQIADEGERTRKLGFASLRSGISGVMWRNYVVQGSHVVVGQELLSILNCENLFVDIIVHEVNYDDIYPDRDAEVRLLGRDKSIPGRVLFVRGSRADFEDKILAATPPRSDGKYAKIRVELPPSDLNNDSQNFCQVGRTAHVRFRARSFPLVRWLRSLWFTIS